MTTPTPNPNTVETLELLRRIAAAVEANQDLLAKILEEIRRPTLEAVFGPAPAQEPAPAPAPDPAPAGPALSYRDFTAESILLSYDDSGAPAYKIKGHPFQKFGVRVWPEALPALGIDPSTLKPGPNPFAAQVRALMGDHGPRKVISLAPGQAEPHPF